MDAFTYIVVGGMAALLVALLLIGKYYPGSGADVLDWKPTRSVEAEVENELDDIEQMLEAQNARRRRRGEPERTEQDIRAQVAADERELRERREARLAERDLEEMLEVANERRRKRGLRPLSAEEYRAAVAAERRDPPPGR